MAFGKLFGRLRRPQAGELGPLALTRFRQTSIWQTGPPRRARLLPERFWGSRVDPEEPETERRGDSFSDGLACFPCFGHRARDWVGVRVSLQHRPSWGRQGKAEVLGTRPGPDPPLPQGRARRQEPSQLACSLPRWGEITLISPGGALVTRGQGHGTAPPSSPAASPLATGRSRPGCGPRLTASAAQGWARRPAPPSAPGPAPTPRPDTCRPTCSQRFCWTRSSKALAVRNSGQTG